MQNVVENYRMALAKRKAARRAEAKAHKHRKAEMAYADHLRLLAAANRAATERLEAMREQAEREAERNEMAGLVFLVDVPRNDYPQE